MRPNALKAIAGAVTGFFIGFASLNASAGTVNFQGATFSSGWIGHTLRIVIDAGGPLSGDWVGAQSIDAIAINDAGSFNDPTDILLTANGFNSGMDGYGLNGGGCEALSGGINHPCFTGSAALSDNMVFDFLFTGDSTPNYSDNPHVKVRFLDSQGQKIGSLLSQNLPSEVPLPGTLGLLGLGLAGLGGVRRKRKPG
jgi:hypothetical protein